MVSAIINGFLKLILKITSILFLPIDLIIENLLPDVADFLVQVQQFMSLPFQYIGWIMELIHWPSACSYLIIAYFIFKYGFATALGGIRYVIKLYQKFKL